MTKRSPFRYFPTSPEIIRLAVTLRDVWRVHCARDEGRLRWRAGAEMPPVGKQLQSPYDPEMHYSAKLGLEWSSAHVLIVLTVLIHMARKGAG